MCKFSIFKKKKPLNVYYQKVEKVIKGKYQLDYIESIHRLGGYQYDYNLNSSLLDNLKYDEILDALKKYEYNSQADNLEFYVLTNKSNEIIILAIIDPVELWENDRIIAEQRISNQNVNLHEFEKIY